MQDRKQSKHAPADHERLPTQRTNEKPRGTRWNTIQIQMNLPREKMTEGRNWWLGDSTARLGSGTREEKQGKGKTARKLGDTGELREVSKEVAAAEI